MPQGTVFKLSAGPTAAASIFYNHSSFDGNDPANNAQDDGAIATDKHPLLPGQTATFANYTSYAKGINGILVDILGLPGPVTANEFTFQVGNDSNPLSWTDAPPPAKLTVRHGGGTNGSDRIDLTWPDNSIKNQWLQVTVKANANTGLPFPYVFYFGNAVGEAGNHAADAQVTAQDELLARANPRNLLTNPAPIDFAYDYNRDGNVNAQDQLIARANKTTFLTALKLITPPANDGNTVAVRRAGVDSWEIVVSSPRAYPVVNAIAVLHVGSQQSDISRYPGDGTLNTLIFTMPSADFDKTHDGDPVTVRYDPDSQSTWDFGPVKKPAFKSTITTAHRRAVYR